MRLAAATLAIVLFTIPLCFSQASSKTARKVAAVAAPKTTVITGPKYDAATEATLKGTIDQISQVQMGNTTHVELVMKSGTDEFSVGVCPPDIFKDLIVSFATGDEVEITGSKVQLDEKPFVIAREIVKGNDRVLLRDKDGTPVWMWSRK
jgi:hypothetical protein